MIQLKSIHKSFGKKVLFDSLDISINHQEMVAVMGPSGCGKTTLLNIIGFIEPFDSGDYYFMERHNVQPNRRQSQQLIRAHISYLFQNYALVENETVAFNLLMALKYVKLKKEAKLKVIKSALEDVGLPGYESYKIFELSGGEQQRVSIARSLIKPSEIILADEPTGSLDSENRDLVLRLLRAMNQKGKTIIIVTHDYQVAQQCDRIIQL